MTTRRRDIDDDEPFVSLADLARYTSIAPRTLKRFMNDPDDPLPAYRIGDRTTVFRKSEFDVWFRNRADRRNRLEPAKAADLTDGQRIAREIRGYPVEK